MCLFISRNHLKVLRTWIISWSKASHLLHLVVLIVICVMLSRVSFWIDGLPTQLSKSKMSERLNRHHGHLYNFHLYGNITQALKLCWRILDLLYCYLWSDFCATALNMMGDIILDIYVCVCVCVQLNYRIRTRLLTISGHHICWKSRWKYMRNHTKWFE